jgi:group I intron endonuclease
MKFYTIYRHTNKINGKSYIGQTCQDPQKRWSNGHGYNAKKQQIFYRAIAKYGWDNFEHEILEDGIASLSEANEREKFWIANYHTWAYDPNCNGYNMTQGGDGSPGRKMSDNTKAKLRKSVYCDELDQVFESLSAASAATGCLVCKISLCCSGKANTAKGYHWRFVDDTLASAGQQQANIRSKKKLEYYKSKSIPVYCIVDNKKIYFDSKTQAAQWWFDTYQPFGQTYNRSVYVKKMQQSIEGKPIYTGINRYGCEEITNIKWFLAGGENNR